MKIVLHLKDLILEKSVYNIIQANNIVVHKALCGVGKSQSAPTFVLMVCCDATNVILGGNLKMLMAYWISKLVGANSL